MKKMYSFGKKKNVYQSNLIWILVYIFLSLNIFSLSPFFVQWTKGTRREYNKNIRLSKIKGLNYQDLLIVDLIEDKQNDVARNLVRRELSQLKSVQYAYKTCKDIRYLLDGGELSIIIHKVGRRENLWTIARKYGVNVGTIISFNNLNKGTISIGQSLKIPSKKGVLHRVKSGEALWDISKAYNLPMKVILETNNIPNASMLKVGNVIFLPGAEYRADYKYYKNYQNYRRELPSFVIRPISGKITSGFGIRRHPIFGRMMFHSGVDIRAPRGYKVKAAMSGEVTYSGWSFGYGRLVVIRHKNGYVTKYAHNSENLVRAGEYVRKGQAIALVGSTGIATGSHLHFEILKKGIPQNPLKYIHR